MNNLNIGLEWAYKDTLGLGNREDSSVLFKKSHFAKLSLYGT